MTYQLVAMNPEHAQGTQRIFNHYVTTSMAAYPETPLPCEVMGKLLASIGGYPAVVGITPEGELAGFAMLRPWHPMPAFRKTAEISAFVSPEQVGNGLGSAMLEWLCQKGKAQGINTILANISSENEASQAFHRKHGFIECGRFKAVGEKWGRGFDVVWMQKCLL